MSAPQYRNRANRSHNNHKFGYSLRPQFFFFFFLSPRGGHGKRKIVIDSHPYSLETSTFTLGAPHEEVHGRQTKLHPRFPPVQTSAALSRYLHFSRLPHCSVQTGLMMSSRTYSVAVDIAYFHFLNFLHKFKEWHQREKYYQKGPQHACYTYLFKHLLQLSWN